MDLNKLGLRIALVGVIPLMALAAVTLFLLVAQLNIYTGVKALIPLGELSKRAGALVHELQIERGTSVGLLTGDDGDDGAAERVVKARGIRMRHASITKTSFRHSARTNRRMTMTP